MLIALIPARSGSKGIPHKNIKLFCGKPLIQWTIEAALNSINVDRVIVSTDDNGYASIAKELGAEVPFIRPSRLARDDSSSISMILHALNQIPKADELLLLQPTSPLRTTEDIDSIISLWRSKSNDAVISISDASIHPSWYPNAKVYCDGQLIMKVGSTKPSLNVDIWSGNHPFYTGSQKIIDTEGRVERFMRKYGLES